MLLLFYCCTHSSYGKYNKRTNVSHENCAAADIIRRTAEIRIRVLASVIYVYVIRTSHVPYDEKKKNQFSIIAVDIYRPKYTYTRAQYNVRRGYTTNKKKKIKRGS